MAPRYKLLTLLTVLGATALLEGRHLHQRKKLDFKTLHVDQLYFPQDFLFGFAIAEQQNSGADNLPDSNWTRFEQTTYPNGKPHIQDNQKSGKACDHWNLYKTDIALMKEDFNANAFRFSLAWDRIEPTEGNFSEEALQHYSDEVDALLEAGITPMITLHHFAHPNWFEDKGGFEKESNVSYFVRYAKKVFKRLGDRVKLWCTINEPTIYTFQGYLPLHRVFPPAKDNAFASSFKLGATVLKNLMMGHTEVYRTLKAMPHGDSAQIGLVHAYLEFQAWTFYNPLEYFAPCTHNRFMVDTVINFLKTGVFDYGWPFSFSVRYKAPIDPSSDKTPAAQLSDFVGLNYYSRAVIKFQLSKLLSFQFDKVIDSAPKPGEVMTDMQYAIYPNGIYKALHHMATIGLPIYITENGIADKNDTNDVRRQQWIREYLKAVSVALEDGLDIRGYFYWTLMDNFEWDGGYHMKFGLYSVNRETQKRSLKEGGKVYADIVKASRSGALSAPTADRALTAAVA